MPGRLSSTTGAKTSGNAAEAITGSGTVTSVVPGIACTITAGIATGDCAGPYYSEDVRTVTVPAAGGRTAAPIWRAFMQKALADQPAVDFTPPAGVKLVQKPEALLFGR